MDETKLIEIKRKQSVCKNSDSQNMNKTLLDLSILTLEKDLRDRNANDQSFLVRATKQLSFFKKLTEEYGTDIHQRCCEKMFLGRLKNQEIVFSKGEIGHNFYIILKGRVAEIDQSKSNRIGLQQVNQLEPGGYFGEQALLTNNLRSTTFKCLDDSVFAMLDKESFKSILYSIKSREEIKQILYLQSLSLFKNFTREIIRTLIYNFKTQNFIKGQNIFIESDPPDNFYIIKQGQVILSKFFEISDIRKSTHHIDDRSKRKFLVSLLGPNEIFGEIEGIQGEKRHFSAVCSSENVVLYYIKSEDFAKSINKQSKDEIVNGYLELYIKDKIEWRNRRIIQIMSTIYMEKQLSTTSNMFGKRVQTQAVKHRSVGQKRLDMEPLDNKAIDIIIDKKLNISTVLNSNVNIDSLNLVESYEKSKFINILLNNKINECNRRIKFSLKERTESCHQKINTSPRSRRIKTSYSVLKSENTSEKLPLVAFFSQSKQQQPSPKICPLEYSLSLFENQQCPPMRETKKVECFEKDFYRRLINKKKLKNSWGRYHQRIQIKNQDPPFFDLEKPDLTFTSTPYTQLAKIKRAHTVY